MSGKSCVVTGASSGIGAATALGLAARGADVVLVGRHQARLDAVAADCRAAGVGSATTYQADFADLAQVRALAERLLADVPRIDVLVNNAAIVLQHRQETVDGYETMFAVNHLAPYLLTRLLSDRLVASAPARIVNVASDGHKFGPMEPDDYMSSTTYRPLKVYGRTKLANILFTVEMAKRLDGSGVTVNCLHPGFVRTGIARDNKLGVLFLKAARIWPWSRSPAEGASTTLMLACDDVPVTGEYFYDGKPHPMEDYAKDPAGALELWEDSADLVGLPV